MRARGRRASTLENRGDRSKFKCLEMPVFLGVNLGLWLFRAKRYFEIHQLTKWKKITTTIINFDEYVVDWYRWTQLQDQILGRFESTNVQMV